MLTDAAKDPEHLASIAGQVLSDMTGFPAIMATVTRREAVVHRVDIMPMGRRTVLLLIITSDGLARSRICRSAFDLPASVVGYFKRLSDAYIIGKELNDFTPAYLQRLVMMCGDLALLMTPLVSSVFEIVEELRSKTISVKGESNLMKCYSNEYDARALLGLLTRQELLFRCLPERTKMLRSFSVTKQV